MWTAKDVRALRKRLRLDESEFAKLLGVELRSVQRWEAGTATPTASAEAVLAALRESLDRQPDDADKIVKFVAGAVAIGGLAYMLVKLFELLRDSDRSQS